MQHRFHDVRNKFSSLAPLSTHGANSPWWILSDVELPILGGRSTDSLQRMASRELLKLMLNIVGVQASSSGRLAQNFWQSPCARFCVGFHKPKLNVKGLYVQNRNDYLSCIELYVDGALCVGFREPVWPHLQRRPTLQTDFLSLPSACVDQMLNAVKPLDENNCNELNTWETDCTECSRASVA